jgi:protocatechuate 3,4-dioxygenase beta subunit
VANGSAGAFVATASTAGISALATYSLRNTAAAGTVAAVARASQTATVGSRYPRPLAARVLDGAGRPVEGATVTFTITSAAEGAGATFVGGGAVATAVTDEHGRAASPALVADTTAGRFGATAAATGVSRPAVYSLRNVAGPPATIAAGAGAAQSTTVGTEFPIRLAVTVTDANRNPVAGAVVVFAAPARGASGRFGAARTAKVITDADGVAVAPTFTAGAEPGGFVVTARVRGAARAAAFALVAGPRR